MSEEKKVVDQKEEVKVPTKEELFASEPDNFFHLSEIIMAVKKDTDDGNKISVYIGEQSEFRLRGALGLLKARVDEMVMVLKMEAAKNKGLIKRVQNQQNKKGFRNFIRGGK